MERVFLTPEEVAEALHVGRAKVYDLIRNGDLVSVKIGKLRRVPADAVREFAQRLVKEAAA
jgi:excisionase family DNA binding protein